MAPEEAVHRLEAVTDTALARLSLEELLSELLVRVRSILGADTAAILLLNGGDLVARVAKGLEEEVEAGAEVRACQSTAEALAELDTWWPDVLLSDIGMPRGGRLLAHPQGPRAGGAAWPRDRRRRADRLRACRRPAEGAVGRLSDARPQADRRRRPHRGGGEGPGGGFVSAGICPRRTTVPAAR